MVPAPHDAAINSRQLGVVRKQGLESGFSRFLTIQELALLGGAGQRGVVRSPARHVDAWASGSARNNGKIMQNQWGNAASKADILGPDHHPRTAATCWANQWGRAKVIINVGGKESTRMIGKQGRNENFPDPTLTSATTRGGAPKAA